ncbi:MAG: cation:proton antiporter [Euryarchaeota archaeon]|nr:cation:proton antiporter [Euryarchaeota archaeon]
MNGLSIEIILLQIFTLFVLAKVAGLICERFKVSSVIGEIFAGIIVANTILFSALQLDVDISLFEILAELGVIFLLFAVGLETPFSELRKVGDTATKVAILGVILPFLAGFAMFMIIDNNLNEALFIGAAMVATSVGITARVISDMNVTRTLESRIIVGAAVIDDVLGMIVLAIVMGIAAGSSGGILDIILISLEAVLFVVLVILLGSILLPKLRKRLDKRRKPKSTIHCGDRKKASISPLPLAIIVCLGLAVLATVAGLAAIIGAFLAGMVFAEFKDKWPCEKDFGPINDFLVPFFFLHVGMLVNIESFSGVLGIAIILTLLAVVTKWVGCGLGARKMGRESSNIVGIGMIPRGEVGIIIAAIGVGAAFISEELFSVVVFMSMATTIIAPPLLEWAFRRKMKADGICGISDNSSTGKK